MKEFLSTTVGKFVVSLVFAIGTLIVAQVAQFVSENPNLFTGLNGGIALLVINAGLFGARNLLNKDVKNV